MRIRELLLRGTEVTKLKPIATARLGHGFGETGFYRLTALDVLLKLNLAVSVHTQLFF